MQCIHQRLSIKEGQTSLYMQLPHFTEMTEITNAYFKNCITNVNKNIKNITLNFIDFIKLPKEELIKLLREDFTESEIEDIIEASLSLPNYDVCN